MSVSAASNRLLGEGLPVTGLSPASQWCCAFLQLRGGGWCVLCGVPVTVVKGVVTQLEEKGARSVTVRFGPLVVGKTQSAFVRFSCRSTVAEWLAKFVPVACASGH